MNYNIVTTNQSQSASISMINLLRIGGVRILHLATSSKTPVDDVPFEMTSAVGNFKVLLEGALNGIDIQFERPLSQPKTLLCQLWCVGVFNVQVLTICSLQSELKEGEESQYVEPVKQGVRI